MVWRRDIPTHGSEGATGFFAAWDMVEQYLDAKNQVNIQLEDRQFGVLPSSGSDWGPRLNAIIAEIEQTNPVVGGVIECYPEQKKISTQVDAFSGKKAITFRSAGWTPSGIFSSRGYGASFYLGANGVTMFKHTNQGAVAHWGPTFAGIVFSAEDFPTSTAPLVLLENVNNWGFDHCSWLYGGTQLKIDARLDLNSGFDASYGELNRATFSHYNTRGLHMVSGQCTANNLDFFQGVSGSWAIELGGAVANSSFHKTKLDTLANGVLNKGYANSFFHIAGEGCTVHLRQDKDTSIAYSGQKNGYYDLHTSFRNTAGEIGVDVTSNVTQFNSIYKWLPWGTVGAGGAALSGKRELLHIFTDEWYDGNGPISQWPARFGAPAAPPVGAGLLYYRSGAFRVMHSDGVERSITTS